jgi:nicotinate phosphoribosyltransferase
MAPANSLVCALLVDQYELTMAYAYFQAGKHEQPAVFDLFFRKNPFGGEFALFAGLEEVMEYLSAFRFTDVDLAYLDRVLPRCGKEFAAWLRSVDASQVCVYAQREGSVVFPRVPLMRLEGPLAVCQLMESAILNLISYSTLIATNAARMKMAAGEDKQMIEFGLRRAQGPDGAVSASRYSYLGGFDGTSNTLAGRLFEIPVSGTQAHSFIQSFTGMDDLPVKTLKDVTGVDKEFAGRVKQVRWKMGYTHTNESELASFVAYAQAFPDGFLALVDTYATLESGVPNFIAVAMALVDLGYQPVGVRLDSGDLAYLSRETRRMFRQVPETYLEKFNNLKIVASNEINEATLHSLNQQGHDIDIFGVGTHLVTCQAQPSLGCVYKLVQIGDKAKIKISDDPLKITIPGRKQIYRLVGRQGYPLVDLLARDGEPAPQPGKQILCCHPYEITKRTLVNPSQVIPLEHLAWKGRRVSEPKKLKDVRQYALQQLTSLREDHLRMMNPTPYKVSLSERLFDHMHELWNREAPLRELL